MAERVAGPEWAPSSLTVIDLSNRREFIAVYPGLFAIDSKGRVKAFKIDQVNEAFDHLGQSKRK